MRLNSLMVYVWILAVVLASPIAAQVAIHGGVAGPAGPQEGVEVALHPIATELENAVASLGGSEELEPVDVSRTDSDGRYRLAAPGPGMWRVRVRAEGMAPMALDLVPLVEELELPELELPSARTTRIQVVSDQDAPISGARVLVVSDPAPARPTSVPSPAWLPARQLATTGEEGYVTLAAPEYADLRCEVVAAGHLAHRTKWAPTRRSIVRLQAAPVRRLEVIGPNGRPAEGVAVTLRGFEQSLGATDATGRIGVSLPADEVRLRLVAPDGAAVETTLEPKPLASEQHRHRIQLAPPRVIEGRVVGLPDGEPLADALVWTSWAPTGVVRTDGRGGYRLPVLPWHEARLNTAAPGYLPDRLSKELPGDASKGPTLVLHPAAAIVGFVLGPGERPLRGAEVTTGFDRRALGPFQFNPPFWQRQTGGRARTDQNGRFRLGNLVPGLEYELRVELAGYPPERVTVAAPAASGPGEEALIVLARGVRVAGRVVDAGRQPVPGARVSLGDAKPGDILDQARRMEDPLPRVEVTSDSTGSFEAGPLAPGVLDLEVEAPGFLGVSVRGLEVPGNGDEPLDLGTVVLSPEAVVRGRVVGPEGEPMPGAAITIVPREALLAVIQDRSPPVADALSGSDGAFELGGLRHGERVKLRIDLAGYALAVVPAAAAGGDPVTVVLDPVRTLAGHVRDTEGSPVDGVLVRVATLDYLELTGGQIPSAAKKGGLSDLTDARGRFRLDGVAAGLLEVVVSASGWQTWRRRLDPWRGEGGGELEVVLNPAAVVSGVVVDAAGQPSIGAEIYRWAPPLPEGTIHYEAPLATTDGDGWYRIDDLPPGRTRLEARHGGSGRAVRELEALAGENLLNFQLEAAGSVSGAVVDQYGSPVPGARVIVRSPLASWVPPRVLADGAGRFEIRGLAAGRYSLDAAQRGVGRSLHPIGFELRDEPVDGLVLELAPTGTVSGRLVGLSAEELSGVRIHAGPLLDVGSIDSEGRYRIVDLSPGPWTIVAEITTTGRRAMGRVELDPSDPQVYLDLDLGAGFALHGVVALGAEPWPGATVTAFGPGGISAGTRTDENGRFGLAGLAAGDYLLEVWIPEIDTRHEQGITIDGDEEVSVVVRPAKAGELTGGQGADGSVDF